MSNYRSELLLPVRRDPRSFEQHQKDAFEEMERFLDNSFKSPRLREKGFKERDSDDVWFADIAKKMDNRRDKWDDEMTKMREEFFQLSPGSSLFGESRGNTFQSGSSNRFSLDSPSSTFRSGGISNHSPRSNYSTSTSSTLNSLPSWGGTTHGKSSTLGLNQSQSLYQRGPEGDMHFQVHFDVSDYQPDDIKVIAKDGKLLVSAKQETILPNGSTLKEFNRTVDIPSNLETSKLTCNLTSDGILVVECPVECPKYQALPNDSNSGCTIVTSKPSLYDSLGYFSTDLTDPYASHGTLDSACGSVSNSSLSRQSLASRAAAQQSLHFEVPVGVSYTPNEIDIKTQDNKIYIHARHEDKSQNRTSFREFSKEYDIPDKVDPFSVTARLENGILFVEAPFKS